MCRQEGELEAPAERGRHLERLHMVWVIQRDFLQGKSTQAALEEALAPVPNPHAEPSIDQARLRSTAAARDVACALHIATLYHASRKCLYHASN